VSRPQTRRRDLVDKHRQRIDVRQKNRQANRQILGEWRQATTATAEINEIASVGSDLSLLRRTTYRTTGEQITRSLGREEEFKPGLLARLRKQVTKLGYSPDGNYSAIL